MKYWLALVAITLIGFVLPVRAQTPWPPDNIFAPVVEIVSATVIIRQPYTTITELPPTSTPAFDDFPDTPEGYTWGTPYDASGTFQPTESPDKRYVIKLAYQTVNASTDVDIFVFDRQEQQLSNLGTVTLSLYTRWQDWTENSIAQLYTYNMGNRYEYDQTVYVIDLRYSDIHPFELMLPVYPLGVFPAEVSATPHITSLFSEGEPPNQHCWLHTYNLLNRVIKDYDYGPFCDVVYHHKDNPAAYYIMASSDFTHDVLVRANPLTGERTDIFTGSFEDVFWISNDEHYAALAVNYRQMNIVDLHNQQVLYEMPASHNEATGSWSPFVRQQSEENWLFISTEYDSSLGANRFLHIDGDHIDEIPADYTLIKTLGEGWFVVAAPGIYEVPPGHLDLYNMKTQQVIPFMDMSDLPYWIMKFDYLGDNQFRIVIDDQSVWIAQTPVNEVVYTVQVKDISLPAPTPTAISPGDS